MPPNSLKERWKWSEKIKKKLPLKTCVMKYFYGCTKSSKIGTRLWNKSTTLQSWKKSIKIIGTDTTTLSLMFVHFQRYWNREEEIGIWFALFTTLWTAVWLDSISKPMINTSIYLSETLHGPWGLQCSASQFGEMRPKCLMFWTRKQVGDGCRQ